MRATFALIVAAVLALAAATAHADVTYDFVYTHACWGGTNPCIDGLSNSMYAPPAQSFILSDAVVASGSATWRAQVSDYPGASPPDYPPSYVLGGRFGIGGGWAAQGNPAPYFDLFENVALAFNANGALSGSMYADETGGGILQGDIALTGAAGSWSGQLGWEGGDWSVTGYWFAPPQDLPHPCCGHGQGHDPDPADPVPEPSSLAIMISAIGAMVGLGFQRRLSA